MSTPAACNVSSGNLEPPELKNFRYASTAPGWPESTLGVDSFDALPAPARAYLRRIEQLTEVPIAMVSTGAERDETILLHHPFH